MSESTVIPVQAGIQKYSSTLGSRLRGNDRLFVISAHARIQRCFDVLGSRLRTGGFGWYFRSDCVASGWSDVLWFLCHDGDGPLPAAGPGL